MVENVELIHEKISDKLKSAGYKLTPQRAATVEILLTTKKKLITAEEVFTAVVKRNPAIGLATVYRTLEILVELNIVKKVQFLDGLTRYDLILSKDQVQPFYLVCSVCKSVTEVKEEILLETQLRIEEQYRFEVRTRDLTFHGLCSKCQKKERV